MEDLKAHGAGAPVSAGELSPVSRSFDFADSFSCSRLLDQCFLVTSNRYSRLERSFRSLLAAREKNKDLMAKAAEITICSPVDPAGATGPKK
jgi:hypothetical protein